MRAMIMMSTMAFTEYMRQSVRFHENAAKKQTYLRHQHSHPANSLATLEFVQPIALQALRRLRICQPPFGVGFILRCDLFDAELIWWCRSTVRGHYNFSIVLTGRMVDQRRVEGDCGCPRRYL